MCVEAMVILNRTSKFYQLIHVFTVAESSGHHLISYEITNSDWTHPRSDSIHGLILTPVFKIWNPTLRRFLALPHPPGKCSWSRNRSDNFDLGYDPLEGKHKVLFMSKVKDTDQPLVLTLGGQESWRAIPKGRCPMHHPIGGEYGQCFNGILYYIALLLGDDEYSIMSFDVKSECFNSINYPEGRSRSSSHMILYEGRLALVSYEDPCDDVELYILQDAHGHKWTRQRFVVHLPYQSLQMDFIRFVGATDAGEFIFAPYGYHEAFYITYFDPKRNTTRKVLFERILDEFTRPYGLDCNDLFNVEVHPNHIESLSSL
ncbi:unnamed protein product [Eruca vesicaria subsp. sativa]|uniref:F-box associated beta-propeller type 3 domain-containing protein n=1 Tax=Eruca vesicaria subsp. sativa TaxID=29727 RepID=A0ABC8KIB4_ERUVS|nr:unnamed protein product [Eruca vesicaria subsp. sativa]